VAVGDADEAVRDWPAAMHSSAAKTISWRVRDGRRVDIADVAWVDGLVGHADGSGIYRFDDTKSSGGADLPAPGGGRITPAEVRLRATI
jgi:hypothetical protein